ncbi:MAG TPA: hypothetical protein VNI57_12335, partial [Candidatus Saccharimonadales bacterium]|nr:hypothetical protein [Candidatus Saccharimonadales bacterium]
MLYLLGVSHRSAPVEVRERLHFRPEEIRESLAELRRSEGIHEAMLLSTCNRTEIVVSGGTRQQAATAVAGLLAHRREEVAASLDRNAYRLEDHE